MTEQEEKKNKRTGLIVSAGIHLALFVLFFFILAWKEPNPPLPEYGIELNFGLDNSGTGSVQPRSTPNNQVKENQQQVVQPAPEKVQPREVQEEAPPQQMEPEKVEEVVQETQPIESPVAEVKKAPQKSNDKPIENKAEAKKAVEEEKPTPKPVERPEAMMPPSTKPATGDKAAPSQGDNANKTGDKGNPEGKIDARALYGTQGGGNGASLDMTGWMWDFIPKPNDPTTESGRIVFEVKVDDQGEIIGVRTVEKTVSSTVEKIYRQAVEQLTFSRTSENTIPAAVSTGRITFILKAR